MSFITRFREKHLDGPGGILALLPIAIPMLMSSMFDMLMMFIDRLFLARVGVVHQAAAMNGGCTSWMVTSFFAGIVSYSSALTAQYYGANQKYNCIRMVWQALWVALLSYPIVLLVSTLAINTPIYAKHSVLEQMLEKRYFWYMAFGSIISLMRFAFSSFFTGIGKTKILMVANTMALFVNFFANWVLIFGHLGFKPLGLDGAAIGTICSSCVTLLFLVVAFSLEKRKPEWADRERIWFDWDKIKKLIRYGVPQGGESILGMGCFVILVSSFHSYGDNMAAATTIAFNWDGMSFHPLLGIQVAVTALVGRAMGQNDPELAVNVTRSGFKVALAYACFMLFLFTCFTPLLVSAFTPENGGLDYSQVKRLATPMLRLTGLYLLRDAVLVISAGALRGAGDTLCCMMLNLFNNCITTCVILFSVNVWKLAPLQVWAIFIAIGMFTSALLYIRYRLGRWKSLRIIEQDVKGSVS